MGYREIGIGAMAQSWLYVGMAVRMVGNSCSLFCTEGWFFFLIKAQDLGMHRSSDSWSCDDEPIFSPVEQQIRKRIWYACVVMDKYVSTYIGRPLSIFEADYDTRLPSSDEVYIYCFSCEKKGRTHEYAYRAKNSSCGNHTNPCRTQY